MCGIAGIFTLNRSSYTIQQEDLNAMNRALLHRGPDDQAIYCNPQTGVGFSFTRLSLLDLQHGKQPMQNRDGSIILIYNGEIYDYEVQRKALQNKGIRFQSYSDTEVLLYLYQEYGIKILNQLNGEFVFALHDKIRQCSIIARDRFGTKSIYYTIQHNTLFFASEMKALLCLPAISASINLETVFHQMMRADSLKRTFFKEISILEPEHYLIVQNGSVVKKRYGSFLKEMIVSNTKQKQQVAAMFDASKKVATLLKASVKKRLMADYEPGIFLSGGLDSTILCAIMNNLLEHPVKTFSLCFKEPGYDESKYSRCVANCFKTDHKPLWIDAFDLAINLPSALFHSECLAQTMDFVGKFLLAKHASNFVKIVITGEGADEIFLGYPWFKIIKNQIDNYPERARALQCFVENTEPTQKGYDLTISHQNQKDAFVRRYGYYPSSINNIQEMEQLTQAIFSCDFYAEYMNNPRVIYEENMITEETTGLSILKKNQLEFLKTTFPLYVLQCLGGKIEMAHSLESRLPFLDIALISYALSLPDHYHLFGMREKNLLRLAFDATIPRLIFGRIKQGYTAPIIRIFLNQKRPAFFDHFLLSQETISAYNIFSYKDIQKTLKIIQYTTIDQQTMTLLERKLMLVLCTHLLYDMFLSNKPHKVPNYH